jgi:hypothetical protein
LPLEWKEQIAGYTTARVVVRKLAFAGTVTAAMFIAQRNAQQRGGARVLAARAANTRTPNVGEAYTQRGNSGMRRKK